MSDIERRRAVRAFLALVTEALTFPEGEEVERPTPDAFVQTMYMRARSLFEGIVVLLDQDLVEEALILARSLFEVSIKLEALEQAEGERVCFILDWYSKSITDYIGLAREAARAGVETDLDGTVAKLERKRSEALDYQKRHGVGRLRPFPEERTLARQVGRDPADILNFLLGHSATHGGWGVLVYRLKGVSPGVVAVHQRHADPDLVDACAGFAARSVLLAHRAACRMFDWPVGEPLEARLSQAEDF